MKFTRIKSRASSSRSTCRPIDLDALRCLLFVAHPDDDAIFAAALQQRLRPAQWTIVYLTHTANSERGVEAQSWQSHLGTSSERVRFLGFEDNPKDWQRKICSLEEQATTDALRALGLAPQLVVTHNERGEYGHPHHRLVHRAASVVFNDTPLLLFGMGLSAIRHHYTLSYPKKTETLLRYFPSQREAIERGCRSNEAFAWSAGNNPAPSKHIRSLTDALN